MSVSKKKIAIVFFLSLFGQGKLADAIELQKFRWIPKSWHPLNLYLPIVMKPAAKAINIGLLRRDSNFVAVDRELVAKSAQYIAGAKVEGTWIQTVYNRSGEAVYSSGVVAPDVPASLSAQVGVMTATRNLALQSLRLQSPVFQKAKRIYGPWEEISIIQDIATPIWVVECVTENEGEVFRARLLASGRLLDLHSVRSGFSDGVGLAYANGPKESALGDVVLSSLSGDGHLTGSKVNVSSALNVNVYQPNLIFQFGVNDSRFDLVQAYYYINKALDWFRSETGFNQNLLVEARLHVGENSGKSNRAYYYRGSVYLGAGDGVLYRDLVRDPSIVFHESAHAVIDRIAGLAPDGETGAFNEGFADLFSALILDNPNMGEASYIPAAFKRSLNNQLKAYVDFKPGVYNNGTIIGGTFWDIRKEIGVSRTAQLALRVLARLGPSAKFSDFVPAVVNASAGFCTDEELRIVTSALVNRGWRAMQNDFENL